MTRQRYFCITFLDQPPIQWDNWFDTPVVRSYPEKLFTFSGQTADLADFMGILSRFQLLNLNPISIRYSVEPEETGADKANQDAG